MRSFDLYVTLPSLLIEPDNERRQLYGKAGAFRPKEYGFEARTLSSYFASSPALMEWVYNQSLMAAENMSMCDGIVSAYDIQGIINSVNKDLALEVVSLLGINTTIAA